MLVRGEGRFTDDVSVPGQAYAVMVRSRHAHGIIRKIDTEAARKMKGVLGVYTGADLAAAGYGTLKCIVPFKNRDGSEMKKPPRQRSRPTRCASSAIRSHLSSPTRSTRPRTPPKRSRSTSSRCRP